jgi:hypothetical protein
VTVISYGGDPVYLCTEVDVNGGSNFYWDDNNDALGSGTWTTSSSASCRLATGLFGPNPVTPVLASLNPIVCPLFAQVPLIGLSLEALWGCFVPTLEHFVYYVLPFPA